LWETIVQHRYSFTRVSGVDYNLHRPRTINPLPPDEIIAAWKFDNSRMIEQMIYEEAPPGFDDLLLELNTLKGKINKIPWELAGRYPVPEARLN
jgi:hypothetical protein